jgi:hypothetical protein
LNSRLEKFTGGVKKSLIDVNKIGEPFKNFASGLKDTISAPFKAVSAVGESVSKIGKGVKGAIGGFFSKFTADKEKLQQTKLLSSIQSKIVEQSKTIENLVEVSKSGFNQIVETVDSYISFVKGGDLKRLENQREQQALFSDIAESLEGGVGGATVTASSTAESGGGGGGGGGLGILELLGIQKLTGKAKKILKSPKIAKIAGKALKVAGIAGVITAAVFGIVDATKNAIAGFDWAGEMDVEGVSGAIGGFLGGDAGGGLANAFKNALPWAGIGAGIGLPFGPVGVIAGGLIGAAVGALLGWIGGAKIAKFIDPIVKPIKRFFGFAIDVTEEDLNEATKLQEDLGAEVERLRARVGDQAAKVRELESSGASEEEIATARAELSESYALLQQKTEDHKEAVNKQTQIARDLVRNEMVSARKRQRQVNQEILRNRFQQTEIDRQLRVTEEGTVRYEQLKNEQALLQAEEERLIDEKKTVDEEYNTARANLLEKDREIVEQAKAEGRSAPLGAKFNVLKADIGQWFKDNIYDGSGENVKIFGATIPSLSDIGEKWTNIKDSIDTWWKDNIYDGSGERVKIFGAMIPTLSELGEKWTNIKDSIDTWWKENVYDGSGERVKIFGATIPTLSDLGEKWTNIKDSIGTWFKDNIFDPGNPIRIFGMELPKFEMPSWGSVIDTVLGWLPWPFNKNKKEPQEFELTDGSEEAKRARKSLSSLQDVDEEVVYDANEKELREIADRLARAGEYESSDAAFQALADLRKAIEYAPAMRQGSGGFRDFGRETLAKLHGQEAVIPRESPTGRLVEAFSTQRESRFSDFMDAVSMFPKYTGTQMESAQRENNALSSIPQAPVVIAPQSGGNTTNNRSTSVTVNQTDHIDRTMHSAVMRNAF